jgi:pyruvate formate lyase activating enzyme
MSEMTTIPGVLARTEEPERSLPMVPELGKSDLRGLIFDVQGHSVHDGPGTRTTVFMNGCPLQCFWCCNPEGLFHQPVMMYSDKKCVHCGRCVEVCPSKAISFTEDDCSLVQNRDEHCDHCKTMECADACLHEAISIAGKYYTVDDLMKLFRRDRQFWGSRGGVTFSGGEPLLQHDFISEVLKKCKQAYIHTCVETTANLSTGYFLQIIRDVNWVFVDIKLMDPRGHKTVTGVDNALILKNIEQLAGLDWDGVLIVRVPIIPNINDSEENIRATARFVSSIGLDVMNILPFHRLGESKYRRIGRTYRFADQAPPSDAHMNRLRGIVEKEGLICFVGHNTPF